MFASFKGMDWFLYVRGLRHETVKYNPRTMLNFSSPNTFHNHKLMAYITQ